jgi:hypothetical protein
MEPAAKYGVYNNTTVGLRHLYVIGNTQGFMAASSIMLYGKYDTGK